MPLHRSSAATPWPFTIARRCGSSTDLCSRTFYTIEIVPDPVARTAMQERLFHALGRQKSIEIVVVPSSPVVGNG